MKRNILLNPVYDEKLVSTTESINRRMEYLGANVGNVVFENAVKMQIPIYREENYNDERYEEDSENTIVWPCSSFLAGTNLWLENLTDYIERRRAKVIMVGVGAQAELNETPQMVIQKLTPKQIRLFKIIAERCKSIGVRGEFTAECFERIGIKNVTIIGCPSVYNYMKGEYEPLDLPDLENVLMTVSPGKRRATKKVVTMGKNINAKWLIQTEGEILKSSNGGAHDIISTLCDMIKFSTPRTSELRKYQETYGKMVWSFAEWNEYLSKSHFTFAYGLRFHGNMMALRNRIPTVWIAHDMRTKELTEALHLPRLMSDSDVFRKCRSVEDIMSHCDYRDFYQYYPKLRDQYLEFLKENGVQLYE